MHNRPNPQPKLRAKRHLHLWRPRQQQNPKTRAMVPKLQPKNTRTRPQPHPPQRLPQSQHPANPALPKSHSKAKPRAIPAPPPRIQKQGSPPLFRNPQINRLLLQASPHQRSRLPQAPLRPVHHVLHKARRMASTQHPRFLLIIAIYFHKIEVFRRYLPNLQARKDLLIRIHLN